MNYHRPFMGRELIGKSAAEKRQDWIVAYVAKHGSVSTIDLPFVEAYVAETGALYKPEKKGLNKCDKLFLDLRALVEEGRLRRFRKGIKSPGPGFPNWTNIYYPVVS